LKIYYEYEITITARIATFSGNPYATVFDILCPESIRVDSIERLRKDSEGDFYALWQTPYFLVRGVLERIFPKHNFKRMPNFMGWLRICSEGGYERLMYIAERMQWYDLTNKLKEWRPNTFHSGDAREVLDWMVEHKYARIITDLNEDIPFGAILSWEVPPDKNNFFEKIFGYLQIWATGKKQTHVSSIMTEYKELN